MLVPICFEMKTRIKNQSATLENRKKRTKKRTIGRPDSSYDRIEGMILDLECRNLQKRHRS